MSATHPQRDENDGQQSTSHPDHSQFYPHASSESKHTITRNRYITSSDPRGYIPVYEYPLNGHWLMIDSDNRYILWTSIWKALGNSKADIVKIVEAQPEIAPQLRRVRGGYLKIQGTWMPYEIALGLARRVAWPIRNDLIPLFGPTFPSTCLAPDQPGFGHLLDTNPSVRRRTRRTTSLGGSADPSGQVLIPYERGNTRLEPTPGTGDSRTELGILNDHQVFPPAADGNRSLPAPPFRLNTGGYHSSWTNRPHPSPQPLPSTPRYSPYPIGERPSTSGFQQTTAMYNSINEVENMSTGNNVRLPPPGSILLPPIPAVFHRPNSLSQQQQQDYSSPDSSSSIKWTRNSGNNSIGGNLSNRLPTGGVNATFPPYTLPPISALDAPGVGVEAGFDVLRRLRMDDEEELERNYPCTNSGRNANSSGSQWENFDSDDNRAERPFQSSIIPSFREPYDPTRSQSTSLTPSDGARISHVLQ